MQSETIFYIGETNSHSTTLQFIRRLQANPAVSYHDAELAAFSSRRYLDQPLIAYTGKPVNIGIFNQRLKNHGRNESIIEAGIDDDVLADPARGSEVLKRKIHLDELHFLLEADQLLRSSLQRDTKQTAELLQHSVRRANVGIHQAGNAVH